MADKDYPKGGPQHEEKGLVIDLIGAGVTGGVAGATNAWVQGKIGQGKNPPKDVGK
jgi:hypothetical protein